MVEKRGIGVEKEWSLRTRGGAVGSYWRRRLSSPPPTGEPPWAEAATGPSLEDRARTLLADLLTRYRGRRLEDVWPLESIATAEGSCLGLRRTLADAGPPTANAAAARRELQRALPLVPGIGPHFADRFRRRGIETVDGLAEHPRFGPRARRLKAALDRDPAAVFRWVRERVPAAHPWLWWTADLFPPEQLLFLDIETLGFFGVAVVVVGVAEWGDGRWQVTQYLASSPTEEPALLAAFARHAAGRVLVTYNGRTFDWPMLMGRAAYWGLSLSHPGWPHYDLLPRVRRLWGDRLPDCRAATVEREILGVSRTDDLPGAFVPEFYDRYLQEGNVGPLVYVVEHNFSDVAGMVRLFQHLQTVREDEHVG
jgi:uncharacterized protein YprB with RNaseH-like and TPR domain